MGKPIIIIPRVGSRRKGPFSSCRSGRLSSCKNGRGIPKRVTHVQVGLNNTIVTVTDVRGRVVSWTSAGTCRFRTARKATPFAAQTAARDALCTIIDQGLQRAEDMIKDPGPGRDAAFRAILKSGIRVSLVWDVTPLMHNGCRPLKKRRVWKKELN